MKWISVKDRLPQLKQSCRFITCDTHKQVYGDSIWLVKENYKEGFYFKVDDEVVLDENITHWMPLPQPPKH